jgi:hypothetical protein
MMRQTQRKTEAGFSLTNFLRYYPLRLILTDTNKISRFWQQDMKKKGEGSTKPDYSIINLIGDDFII